MAIGTKANAKDNSKRRYEGGGPRPDNNKIKRDEAKERQEAWARLSPVQQLKELDRRLGEGQGAGAQRTRILARIEKAKNKPVEQGIKPGELHVVGADTSTRVKAKDRRAQERTDRPNK